MPLHEWKGFVSKDALSDNIITWVFEEDSFSPIAKLRGEKKYSILADHLGTPIEAYADDGNLVWERSLNANGKVIKETGIQNFCPFLYQGQSFDNEIELAYNRFRYYDVEDGRYISQDPIGLLSGEFGFYNYVHDTNVWIDEFGLSGYNKQRWKNKIRKDGKPYRKPGPKKHGKHSKKINEIIKREKANGSKHIGGGRKEEIIIPTPGGHKPYRRADASFIDTNGNEYHINVGLSNKNGTKISREQKALDDVIDNGGKNMTFESYGIRK